MKIKIKNIKKSNPFILFLIVIFGFLLRIWYLDKPEGLWNDEYVGWYIASRSDFYNLIINIIRNCHMPLYYFYLKLWMLMFGDTDYILRYSSVIPSVLSIVVMYFSGKELKNFKFGFLTAFITAISSFLIYFSQEVRLYSLIFLTSSLIILFGIKLLKNIKKSNIIIFLVLNVFLILLHTLGIIFSFFNISFIIYFYIRQNENYKDKIFKIIKNKYFAASVLILLMICIPFIYFILTSQSLSQFWSGFSVSKIILTFTDYFSPIQANIINSPDTFSSFLHKDKSLNYVYIIFSIIPALIALYGIIYAVKTKNIFVNYLTVTSLLFFLSLIFFSIIGRMVLITKYSIEMYPALILLFLYGLAIIRIKKVKYILLIIFVLLNMSYILLSADAAERRTRPEGHYAPVQLLKASRLKENDFVLLTYYDKKKFDRYLVNAPVYNIHSISKYDFNYFMYNNADYKDVIKNGKKLYKENFRVFPDKTIQDYSKYTFKNEMKKGDRIGIIFLDNVSFISNSNIEKIINDDKLYKKTPFIFLVFSTLKNNLLYSFKNDFKLDSITQAGDWTLFVYEKIN